MFRKIPEEGIFGVAGSMPAFHAYLSGWLIALAELLSPTPTAGGWNVQWRRRVVTVLPSLDLCVLFNFQNAYVNINRIMSVASRLSEAGHYASQQIKQISSQLDQEWKSFAAALDERSTILAMSAVFHQKAEQVSCSCDWQSDPLLLWEWQCCNSYLMTLGLYAVRLRALFLVNQCLKNEQ